MIAAVTGGTGLVGRSIVRRLLSGGHEVRVLSRDRSGSSGGVEYFWGAMQDADSLRRFVSGAQMIFNCAAEIGCELRMREVNVRGTERLLGAAEQEGCRYFCHLSSAAVVGEPREKWVDEESPCDPRSAYEKTKWEGEWVAARGAGRCSVVILRPTNVVDDDRPGALIHPMRGSWLDRAMVFLKGGECAHIVHADDVAAAALFFAERPAGRPRRFFVSCDDDPANTFAGLWALFRQAKGGGEAPGTARPMPHLPLVIPALMRWLWRGGGIYGDVRFSSRRLRSEGFEFPVGVRGAVRRLASRGAGALP
jgi:nucleoside-diphosphate-sugar epimerase